MAFQEDIFYIKAENPVSYSSYFVQSLLYCIGRGSRYPRTPIELAGDVTTVDLMLYLPVFHPRGMFIKQRAMKDVLQEDLARFIEVAETEVMSLL